MDIVRIIRAGLKQARQHPKWTLGGSVALIALLGLLRASFHEEIPEASYYEVKRGDFLVTIVEGGTLQAVNEVVVRNEVEGSARIIYIVPEGTYVKKDALLVQLDTADAEDKVNQQQISYEKANAAYVQAEKNLEIEKSVIQSSIDAAELKVRFAELDLRKFKEGAMLQELRNAEIEITTATGDLLLAKDNLDWSVKLYEKGFETKNAVDQGSNTVQDLTLRLEKAQTNLWMITQFDHPKMLETYESSLEEAQKELERVKAQGEGKIAALTADLETQKNSLELTREKLENDKEQLAKSKIYAPQDGLVVYAEMRSRFSSQTMIEEGAMIRERQELIKLPDTSQMKVGIKVHESHVNKVHAGQPAFVVLDNMPDKRFQAVVSKVAVLPDTQAMFGNPNLKVYKTEVVITDKLPDVKPGVSARAEIVITNILQALTVPVQAVTSFKGKTVVFTKRGGDSVPVPVEVGLFNTKFIEVTSGLKEGDQVMLAPPYDVEEKDLGGAIIGEDRQLPKPGPIPESARTEPLNANGGPPSPEGPGRTRRDSQNPDDRMGPPRSPPRPGDRTGAPGEEPGADGRRGNGGRSGLNREEMLKQFDKNGDGQLDESERAAMRERFGNRGPRGGTPGNRQPPDRSESPQP